MYGLLPILLLHMHGTESGASGAYRFYCWRVYLEASICTANRAAVTTSRMALATTRGWSR